MFSGYAHGPPTSVAFDEEFALEDWPAKGPGDVGWTYLSILGPDFVEAVTVTVANIDGALLIREVEWGRP
jgi:hypothetical protein